MKRYKPLLREENSLSRLNKPELVDKLIEFFKANPYPQDDSGIHKFAESLGIDADELEIYCYAIISCFITGGNFNKSGKKAEDFDPKEIETGIDIEKEHTDYTNENPVVKHIAKYMQKRIAMDHLSEFSNYYTLLVEMEKKGKELVKK
jgi:hypothetical protein